MSRRLWAAGALAFGLTLLCNLPAGLLHKVDWPPGWQPEQVSGTLWDGQIVRLGPFGPLAWQLSPWRGQARVQAGLAQQAWALTVSGWPWQWQAQLVPAAAVASLNNGYLIEGHWQGHLHLEGQGRRCRVGSGALQGQNLALLSPWTLNLGNARLSLDCQQGLQVLAEIQRQAEHSLQARFTPASGRLHLGGEVQPQAALIPLLVQAGLLKPGTLHVEKDLSLR